MLIFHTYLEYNARDFFLEAGWSDDFVRKTSELRDLLPDLAREYGFIYSDWSDEVADFSKRERSIFARFALYADHCHLSPLGNRLMADLINASFLPVLQRASNNPSPQ